MRKQVCALRLIIERLNGCKPLKCSTHTCMSHALTLCPSTQRSGYLPRLMMKPHTSTFTKLIEYLISLGTQIRYKMSLDARKSNINLKIAGIYIYI